MSFIKKLRLSKRLPSVLSKSLNKQQNAGGGVGGALASPNGLPAITEAGEVNAGGGLDGTLDESMTQSHALVPAATTMNTTLNTTTSGTTSSKSGKSGKQKSTDSRSLVVYHIDSETEGTLSLTVRNDDNGETVLNKVCDYYSLSSYKEYFGLKYTLVDEKGDHEIFWLDPFKLVGKQLKGTNDVLTFRVKHFPGKPQLIESEYVRYLIFLQIRNYLLKGDLQLSLTDEARLAAYAVQAYLGDYEPELHHEHYLTELKFLPQKSLKAEETIIELHKELRGKTPAEMELAFLEKVSQFDTYGAELIVVKNSKGVEINFGVSHNGIITFLHGQPCMAAKTCLYHWNQIGKISYDGRTLKVHAHTPDVKNPEIFKKQVMVFKCNSKRICKHLWKFILDQKAFFNFKRGIDVPKIKSSSSFFSHKSKFRFSGRCENELITAQYDNNNTTTMMTTTSTTNPNSSIFNISPLSIATSSGAAAAFNPHDMMMISKTSTLPASFRSSTMMSTFKRRNFLKTHHSQAHSPNSIGSTTAAAGASTTTSDPNQRPGNDPNNNNLLLKRVDDSNEKEQQQHLPESTSLSPLTVQVDNKQNLTSTPQPSSLPKEMSHARLSDAANSDSNNNNDNEDDHHRGYSSVIEPKDNSINNNNNNINGSSDTEDEFYDHDQILVPKSTTPVNNNYNYNDLINYSNLNRQFDNHNNNNHYYKLNGGNNNNSMVVVASGKKRRMFVTVTFMFVGVCLVLFVITIIQYAACNLTSSSEAVARGQCQYSRIVSRLNDNLSSMNRRVLSVMGAGHAAGAARWLSWPIYSPNSSALVFDPLFSWFFKQYEPN